MTTRPSFQPVALALLMATSLSAAPGHAQDLLLSADPMVQARAAEARHDPAEALARYLRVLSMRPKDLGALTGAGRAALDIGDPRAAIGFYARAEEIAPRNGQVKAGLGTAMLQMENPKAALKLFADAVDLGVPSGEVAGDRGLAYDLRGDNKRAQQEYALALKMRDDPETVRRLALSLAMTGDRAGALAVLDPLLRRQDIPAWRVRAFILALTGDATGAETAALAVMPRPQAMALLPFLARLKALKPQQQAAAVHFGHFPSDGRRFSDTELSAGVSPAASPAGPGVDAALIPSGAALGRGDSVTASNEPVSLAPRRRPGSPEDRLASANAPAPPPPVIIAKPVPKANASLSPKPEPAPIAKPAPVAAKISVSDPFIGPPKAAVASREPRLEIEPGFSTLPAEASRRVRLAQAGPSVPKSAASPKVDSPKAQDAQSKDDAARDSATKGKAKDAKGQDGAKDKDSAKKDGDKAKDAKSKDAKAKTSERYWAQVAGGANKADLPKAFARLKEKSPKLFVGRSAWTTPLRATNRLLVGPFKTIEAAQDFVNLAGKESLSAFAYTSPAGQEIEKLGAK